MRPVTPLAAVGVVAHHTEEHHDRATPGVVAHAVAASTGRGTRRRRSSRRRRAVARRHGSDEGVAGALRRSRDLRRTKPLVGGDEEPPRHVGTLRAMSAEDSGGDGAPEPDDAPQRPSARSPRPPLGASQRAAFVRQHPQRTAPRAAPREWAIGVGSAVAAVFATVLVLVAFGALGGRHRSPIPPPVVTNPGDVVDYAVAERVGTAVAAERGDGPRPHARRHPAGRLGRRGEAPTGSSPPPTTSPPASPT